MIYLVRKRAIGDVLWIEPVIRQLLRRHSKIIVYTKFPELFSFYPNEKVIFKSRLSLIVKLLLKTAEFFRLHKWVINLDLAYEKNPKMHFLHAYQQKAGTGFTEEYPIIHFSEEENHTKLIRNSRYVVLHVKSEAVINYRNVFGIDWELIVNYLQKLNYKVVQVGKSPDPIKGVQNIETSIREMMVLIRDSSFFIGIDSGPSHIAASLGIPSLIFFGAVNPELRHFKKLFRGYFLQQACIYAGCYHETTSINDIECRIIGNMGIPPCSLHSNLYVTTHIDLLINKYFK